MKLSILQSNLLRALAVLAASKTSPLPVLGNVLIRTNGGRVEVCSTNLDMWIIATCGARIEEEGAITVPAIKLRDYVQSLPDGRLELVADYKVQSLTVSYGGVKSATIKGIDAEEFPVMPQVPEGGTMADGDAMKKAIAELLKVKLQ